MRFVTEREPPPNRIGIHEGPLERHLTEAAVMLAMAEWLFGQGANDVRVHTDGLHMKGFDMPNWLAGRGFKRVTTTGRAPMSGTFCRNDQTLIIHARPASGREQPPTATRYTRPETRKKPIAA